MAEDDQKADRDLINAKIKDLAREIGEMDRLDLRREELIRELSDLHDLAEALVETAARIKKG